MKIVSFKVLTILSIVALSWLSGCSTIIQKPSEKDLLERATIYWKARQARDLQTILKMESAGRPGGWLTPMNIASLGSGVVLRKVQVSEPVVQSTEGKVKVTAKVQMIAFTQSKGLFDQVVEDPWVYIDGQWYHKTFEPKSHAKIAEEAERRRQQQKEVDIRGQEDKN
jgi:hypothetical protein